MNYEPDETLAENYRGLAKERGATLPDLAPEYEQHSPSLAAWMRSQAAGDAPEAREQAPEQRSADPTLITAEATTPTPEPVPDPAAGDAPEARAAAPEKPKGRQAPKPKEA